MFQIRVIQASDNPELASIVREVSKEFGLAPESGFAVADPSLDDLYAVYTQPHSQYWVIVDEHNKVYGGAGLSPLKGAEHILEIQKMYFLPELRGHGFAKKLLELCFEFAQQHGVQSCYLETTKNLSQAIKLYEKLGFKYLDAPLGQTGHSHACEYWMEKDLTV
ncbi:GNAT family N-acetyltransferase [Acinetobacter shaoyimingii]|uniref:GNAT family N-acetyltransferase n=1 Tax=Acinetobacter shaoyimingii TaxID=2715164 RepID=A0A6G8RVL4_9GAMM|nr:GNAT family N-acetyltransferase [Acinetobacter shaoyimingii]NHB57427.1 GNAT family N-acetyltransferase [Acinetobacter shaoyimingii]QIO05976.1 GNAT family N-acetyltransferase [Acinetobacter shaoyimingii]